MGQTLPHGVYLPDNGERNCYVGLSQNWQKLDNLLGNQGSNVSFSQTLTEGVEIGKITINGVDVSLYHTDYSSDIASKANASDVYTKAEVDASLSEKADKATTLSGYGITDAYTKAQVDNKISGLVNSAPETLDTLNELASALGNDPNFATTVANQIGSKANDSDVVHKSGNETIGGIKTFNSLVSDSVNCKNDESRLFLLCGNGWGDCSFIWINGKNSYGWNTIKGGISINPWDGTNLGGFNFTPNGEFISDNGALGTSTNKWKTINGINPGALSLPGTDTGYVNIKATVGQYLRDNNTNIYEFTAPFDGWICVEIVKGSLRIDNVTLDFSSGSEIIGYWQSYTIPFRKNDVIQVKINKMNDTDDYVNDIMWKAYIYPCQGNV